MDTCNIYPIFNGFKTMLYGLDNYDDLKDIYNTIKKYVRNKIEDELIFSYIFNDFNNKKMKYSIFIKNINLLNNSVNNDEINRIKEYIMQNTYDNVQLDVLQIIYEKKIS